MMDLSPKHKYIQDEVVILSSQTLLYCQIPVSRDSLRESRQPLLLSKKGIKHCVLMPARISAAQETLISCASILKVMV